MNTNNPKKRGSTNRAGSRTAERFVSRDGDFRLTLPPEQEAERQRRAGGPRPDRPQLRELPLKRLRESRGVTQAAIASRLGVKQSSVSQQEGQSDIKLSTLVGYLEALDGGRVVLELDDTRIPLTAADLTNILPLRRLREERRLTQVAVGERLGLQQDAVVRLERQSDIKLSTLVGYLEALDGGRVVLELDDTRIPLTLTADDVLPLRRLREERHLTQAAVGERLGMQQDAVQRLERQDDIKLSTLAAYADALGGRIVLELDDARVPLMSKD